MINPTQNHLLQQMQALQSLAEGKAMQADVRVEQQPGFAQLMQQAIDQVNETQHQATSLARSFELGEQVD